MRYLSTRGGMTPQPFTDILLEGLAPDGGLAVPEAIPRVDAATLAGWRDLSYADLATEVLRRFITDIPVEDLRQLAHAAYTPAVFGCPA
ncbi:MAG: threonine synthase, partial [Pigmentiphaga sp.]